MTNTSGCKFFRYSTIVIMLISGILAGSCDKESEFLIGNELIDSNTKLQVIDTFYVELSTVKLDSLPTSGTGVALVGSYTDTVFGRTSVKSYFEVGYPVYTQMATDAVFDSLTLFLNYSSYSYGDTTLPLSVSLYRLEDKLTLTDYEVQYNNKSFKYNTDPVCSVILYPEPNSEDSVNILINDSFGRELFNHFKANDEFVSTEDHFLDYIKGFVLESGSTNNQSIIGFNTDPSTFYFRMFYHRVGETIEKSSIDLMLSNSSKQFNGVENDFTGTRLSLLNQQRNGVNSAETGNMAFFQAGVGLMPKIRFPTLQNILLAGRGRVLKAEVIIEPVKTSYNFFSLPEKIYLYETDNINRVFNNITDNAGNYISATLVPDEMYREEASYTFDISAYLINELSDNYWDNSKGLLIGTESTALMSTFDRLVVEGRNPSVKLKIYYLFY